MLRTVELSGGEEYLSQLVLASVVPNTAGLYVCLVTTSSGGFNFQRSFLTVKQSKRGPSFIPSCCLAYLVAGFKICLKIPPHEISYLRRLFHLKTPPVPLI